MLRLLDERDFDAQFHVGESKLSRTCASGEIDRIIRRSHDAPGQDGVQLYAGKCAPVKLEGRPGGIHLCGGAIDAAEDVELVVMEIDRDGIVGLVGWALRTEPRGHAEKDRESGKPEALAAVRQRRFVPGKGRVHR